MTGSVVIYRGSFIASCKPIDYSATSTDQISKECVPLYYTFSFIKFVESIFMVTALADDTLLCTTRRTNLICTLQLNNYQVGGL